MDTRDDIFEVARQLPVAEREAYLKEACTDEDQRERVMALLKEADDASGGPRKAPPVPVLNEREGSQIGPYILRQRLGEGGFGIVWMAEQKEPISRMVALKVIKAGMDTRQVLARFEAERQALAMMDHPNISRVLDAGATAAGRPYFAMELVKGIPITNYCDEAGLTTQERLGLFKDVCSAINHAHQKGIIHRDLKPSNVMVTLHGEDPVVKVIDFGIAKATQGKLTDKTLFTRFEQFIGTPVYMSPEQAALSGLDIDTRSDIYALGVLLYELLTGKPPFEGSTLLSAGYDEMRRIIREVEPPKPSSRLSTVAGEERTTLAKARRAEPDKLHRLVEPDLDWIVMKAIEKDRGRRYETANAFAQDIEHFLRDEPVSASPPSVGYLFRKFTRRHRTAFRMAAIIALLLLAATAVSIWQAVRATRAEYRAVETLTQVAAERDAKEQARREAEAIANFLTEVFQSPDPTRDGRTITVAETLDKAAARLGEDESVPPAVRAGMLETLGNTYLSLGLAGESVPLREEAYRNYREIFGEEHPDTLSAMHNLALSLEGAGLLDEAFELRRKTLALRRKVNGPEHPDTLRAMEAMAGSFLERELLAECIALDEELLALRRKVLGDTDPGTLNTMHNLANVYAYVNRLDEALELQEKVLPLRIEVNGPRHPDTLRAMHNLAHTLHSLDRHPEAFKLSEETLALRKDVLGPDHPDTVVTMGSLANEYGRTGKLEKALEIRREVLEISRRSLGPEHPGTLGAMTNLAISYGTTGRIDEALALQEKSLQLKRRVLPPTHRFRRIALQHMIFLLEKDGRTAEAAPYRAELAALPSAK